MERSSTVAEIVTNNSTSNWARATSLKHGISVWQRWDAEKSVVWPASRNMPMVTKGQETKSDRRRPLFSKSSCSISPVRSAEHTLESHTDPLERWILGEDISEGKDHSIVRRTLKKGEGWAKPIDGSSVEVTLKGTNDGQVFDERTVSFTLGEGFLQNIPEGFEVTRCHRPSSTYRIVAFLYLQCWIRPHQDDERRSCSIEIEIECHKRYREVQRS